MSDGNDDDDITAETYEMRPIVVLDNEDVSTEKVSGGHGRGGEVERKTNSTQV